MKRQDTNRFAAEEAEEPKKRPSRASAEEEGEDAPQLDEFARRRRGPDLRLPLGLLVTLLLIGGLGYLLWQYMQTDTSVSGTLILNEICSANHQSLLSPTLDSPDWVELYNASGRALSLKGYGLSDNPKQSYKYILPDMTLEPGAYLIIYFTGGSEAADNDPLCTGFGLSRYGESLLLVDATYTVLDSVEVPALEADVSYARGADGEWGYAVIPTPGEANGEIIPAWK